MLDNLDFAIPYPGDDGDVPVSVEDCPFKNEDIVNLGFGLAGVGVLKERPFRIVLPIGYRDIKKVFGVPVAVGHFVVQVFVVIPFHKLYTLILEPNIIPLFYVPPGHISNPSIVVDLNAIEAIDGLPDFIAGVEIAFPRCPNGGKPNRE